MEYKNFQLVFNLVEYQTHQLFTEKLVSYKPHHKLTVSQLGQEETRICNEAKWTEYEHLGIFHAPLPTGIKTETFEIFCKINNSNEAQFRITKFLIASDVETPGGFPAVFCNVVGYKVFWDEYFSAFLPGTFPLHINN